MRTLLIAVFGALLASAASAQTPACTPVPGVEALWAKPETRFVIFGEFHGTAETPAFFADVACHAAAGKRPLLIGLEYEEGEQAVLDRFMGSPEARYEPNARASQDGRRSEAMMGMLERLRALRASGAEVELLAFLRDSPPAANQTPHEQAMASAWLDAARRRPDALILALVGNIHALKGRVLMQNGERRELPFTPAATFLPPDATLSVRSTLPGGEAWGCRPPPNGCGGYPLPVVGVQHPRGIHLRPEPGMDGRFSVGRPFTPSFSR